MKEFKSLHSHPAPAPSLCGALYKIDQGIETLQILSLPFFFFCHADSTGRSILDWVDYCQALGNDRSQRFEDSQHKALLFQST